MKKTVLALVLCTSFAFAQETTEEKQGWTKGGNFSFLANQSTFNNWLAGGQSNMSGNIGANYDFNYKAGNVNWDNKLIVAYGLTKLKDVNTQKTDDRIEFNSLYGKKAKGHWFYSAFLNFKTQMDTGLDPETLTTKVTFENILNLYSNYLEDPQNVDVDYQLNIVLKVNKYLSTNFAFQAIYDDNALRDLQTRQVIGVGVNYGF